jgi:hypothetical protein
MEAEPTVSVTLPRDRVVKLLRGGVVSKIAIVTLVVVAFLNPRPREELTLAVANVPEPPAVRSLPVTPVVTPIKRQVRPKIWRRQFKLRKVKKRAVVSAPMRDPPLPVKKP